MTEDVGAPKRTPAGPLVGWFGSLTRGLGLRSGDAGAINEEVKDRVTEFLTSLACAHLDPQRIWLFGSRARADHRERSDYDFAFQFRDKANWARFVVECREQAPTLCEIDLVDIDGASKELRVRILEEGVIVYEREET